VISVPTTKRKRGIRHTEDYKRNVIKKARVGKRLYTNWNGLLVPAKNAPDTIKVNW
jgi:hypothetical protein